MSVLKKEYKVVILFDESVFGIQQKAEQRLYELEQLGEIVSVSFMPQNNLNYCFITFYIHRL